MVEDKLLQSSRSSDKNKKKKKKKRKKASASTSPPQHTEKPQAASLPPETSPVSWLPPQSPSQPPGQLPKLRVTNKKDREQLTGSGRRSKRHSKDSPSLLTATNKTSGSGSPVQGCAAELSAQARESLRWEEVQEDPQAEEKRLELYRANRRQRYISHRDALLKETQQALRQTFPKESEEKKSLTGSEKQEQRLFYRLKQM